MYRVKKRSTGWRLQHERLYSPAVQWILLRWIADGMMPPEVVERIGTHLDDVAFVMLSSACGLHTNVGPIFVYVAAECGHAGVLNKYGCGYPSAAVMGAAFRSHARIVAQWMPKTQHMMTKLLKHATRYSNHATWCEIMYRANVSMIEYVICRVAERKDFEFGCKLDMTHVRRLLELACSHGGEWIERVYDWLDTQKIECAIVDDVVKAIDDVQLYMYAEQQYNWVFHNAGRCASVPLYRSLREWGPNVQAWLNIV